jgi:hypothetical protein
MLSPGWGEKFSDVPQSLDRLTAGTDEVEKTLSAPAGDRTPAAHPVSSYHESAHAAQIYNKAGTVRINITLRRVRVTIVTVERQQILNILSVCL